MRLTVAFLALMVFSDVSSSCASGIDPEQITAENARERLEAADLAFRGTVISSEQTDDGVQRVLIEIDVMLKGPPAQQLYVLNNSLFLSCSAYLASGGDYYVFGKFTDVSNEVHSAGFVSVGKANDYKMDLRFDK